MLLHEAHFRLFSVHVTTYKKYYNYYQCVIIIIIIIIICIVFLCIYLFIYLLFWTYTVVFLKSTLEYNVNAIVMHFSTINYFEVS